MRAILLRHIANEDVLDENSNAAIHLATQLADVNTLLHLIEAGSNTAEKGEDGDRPMYTAAYYGRKEMLQVLYDKGASVNAWNDFMMFYKWLLQVQ